MGLKRLYTVESVHRALTHHATTGAVERIVECPLDPSGRWLVELPSLGLIELKNLDMAYALALGLRAGEVARSLTP